MLQVVVVACSSIPGARFNSVCVCVFVVYIGNVAAATTTVTILYRRQCIKTLEQQQHSSNSSEVANRAIKKPSVSLALFIVLSLLSARGVGVGGTVLSKLQAEEEGLLMPRVAAVVHSWIYRHSFGFGLGRRRRHYYADSISSGQILAIPTTGPTASGHERKEVHAHTKSNLFSIKSKNE